MGLPGHAACGMTGIMPHAGICRIAAPFSSGARLWGCGIIQTLCGKPAGVADAGPMDPIFIPARYFEALRGSPLRSHVERYISQNDALGFSPSTICYHTRLLVRFAGWIKRTGLELRDYDEAVCESWAREHLYVSERKTGGRQVLVRLLAQLRAAGVTPPAPPPPRTAAQSLADAYREFLVQERGLVRSTVYHYARHAERFLSERFGSGRVQCPRLRARDVTDFVHRHAREHSRGYALQLVNALRSFF
jgi:hypothetical protein